MQHAALHGHRHGPAPALASRGLLSTSVGAIGVVFGDIGTSPLYTLQVAGEAAGKGGLSRQDLFGVVSLILWALIVAVSIKYVAIVMRANNDGAGGIFALLALLPRSSKDARVPVLALLAVAGAALLFGDGMITPAISVLSAFEGLERAKPGLHTYAIPLTCAALISLFALQRRGTKVVGELFGPVMVLWFVTAGVLGLKEVVKNPEILLALSPHFGVLYFAHHGLAGLPILGVVVLAITGAEALYADMGYFGSRPIRLSWFALVLPALALSYLGQGALVLREPAALARPFFRMANAGAPAYALVVLAALATIIASQALISGVFALTHQAVSLGYFPRLTVVHTSRNEEQHIYVPLMNTGLMLSCVALVIGFGSSARLASAYGIAVSGTMVITSVAFFGVARKTWKWSLPRAGALLAFFLAFDVPVFVANVRKFTDGGYIPIAVAAFFFVIMVDWHAGRRSLLRELDAHAVPLTALWAALADADVRRVPGTAIYLTASQGTPRVLSAQLERLRAVPEHVALLTVRVEHTPRVSEAARAEVERLAAGCVRVLLHFGYMEAPRVPRALRAALEHAGIPWDLEAATYYVGHQTITGEPGGAMKPMAERLFAFLTRNTRSSIEHFALPKEAVVEYGVRMNL